MLPMLKRAYFSHVHPCPPPPPRSGSGVEILADRCEAAPLQLDLCLDFCLDFCLVRRASQTKHPLILRVRCFCPQSLLGLKGHKGHPQLFSATILTPIHVLVPLFKRTMADQPWERPRSAPEVVHDLRQPGAVSPHEFRHEARSMGHPGAPVVRCIHKPRGFR